jgi:hypothetical protein
MQVSEESLFSGQPVEMPHCPLKPVHEDTAPSPATTPQPWWEGPLDSKFLPGQASNELFPVEQLEAAKARCLQQVMH